MREYPKPVFIGIEGGGTSYTNAEIYFYLVVNGLSEATISQANLQDFFQVGIDSRHEYVFVLIDISTDNRLENSLRLSDEGVRLWETMYAKLPVLAISRYSNLSDLNNTKNVEIIQILDYVDAATHIFDKMGMPSPGGRRKAIELLRRVNSYVEIKVGVPGIAVLHVSKILADLIELLERHGRAPPPPLPPRLG